MTSVIETPEEERRGKKRTLNEVERDASELPSPKRRKCHHKNGSTSATQTTLLNHSNNESQQEPMDIADDDHEDDTAHPHSHSQSNGHASAHTVQEQQQKRSAMPTANAKIQFPSNHTRPANHEIIDLLDSDSPTTNESTQSQSNTAHPHQNQHTDVEMSTSAPCAAAAANANGHTVTDTDTDSVHYDFLSIYTDERCLQHAIPEADVCEEFNERPARLKALLRMVDEEKWNTLCRFIPKLDDTHVPSVDDIKNSCGKIMASNWNVASGSDTYLVRNTLD